MATLKINISGGPDKMPPNTAPDFEWARENRKALFEQHGRCVALIYKQHVVGTGETIDEAVENADKALPLDAEMITPIVFVIDPPPPAFSEFPSTLREQS
jgi:hypothetical protein